MDVASRETKRRLVRIHVQLGQWETFNAARQAMLPNFANQHAAARYGAPKSGDRIAAQ
jgi:hypothetical protein